MAKRIPMGTEAFESYEFRRFARKYLGFDPAGEMGVAYELRLFFPCDGPLRYELCRVAPPVDVKDEADGD